MAALVILNQLDEIERYKADHEAFKRALAARSDMDIKKMWPEYFEEAPKQEEVTEAPGGSITPDDYQNVDWKSPKDDPEAWKEMMTLLSKGQMSGEEVTGQADPSGAIEWTDWR